MTNDSKNSKGWRWALLLMFAIAACDKTKQEPAVNVIRQVDLPLSYMTIISTDSVIHPDRKILETSEKNWCEAGHTGNQVLLIVGSERRILTFEELKGMMK